MFDCAVEKASIHDSTFKYDGESWGREPFTVTTLSEDDEYELMKFAWEYWDEQAAVSERAAQVVQIYKDYNSELEGYKWHRLGRALPWE